MLQDIIVNKSNTDFMAVRPPLTRRQELLLLCFHSGQIEPSAWEQHLREDPALCAYLKPSSRGAETH